jgi:hypothetical protein
MENQNNKYGVILEGSASSITKGTGRLFYEAHHSTFFDN